MLDQNENNLKQYFCDQVSIFNNRMQEEFLTLEDMGLLRGLVTKEEVDKAIRKVFVSFLECGEYLGINDLLIYKGIELDEDVKREFLKNFPDENGKCPFINESKQFIEIVLINDVKNYKYLNKEHKENDDIIEIMLKKDVESFKLLSEDKRNLYRHQKCVMESSDDIDFLNYVDIANLSDEIFEMYINKTSGLLRINEEEIEKLKVELKDEEIIKKILNVNPYYYGNLGEEYKAKEEIIRAALESGDIFAQGLVKSEYITKKIAMRALEEYYDIWDSLPLDFKNDKRILLNYLQHNSVFLKLDEKGNLVDQLKEINQEYLEDKEVAVALLGTTSLNFRCLPEKLRLDREFLDFIVTEGIIISEDYNEILKGEMKTDIEFNKMLVGLDLSDIKYIDQEFALTKEFLFAIKDDLKNGINDENRELLQIYYDALRGYEREDELKDKFENMDTNKSEGRKRKI